VDSLPIKPYWTKIWEYLLVWLCAVSQKSCIFVQVCNSYSSQAPSAGFLIYNMLLRFLRSVQSSTRFKNKTFWKSWNYGKIFDNCLERNRMPLQHRSILQCKITHLLPTMRDFGNTIFC
jgi:hypothetical protein